MFRLILTIFMSILLILTGCQKESNNYDNAEKSSTPVKAPTKTAFTENIKLDNKEKILFYSDRTSHMEIYVMNYDGKNPQRLTYYDTYTRCPDWSPDGQKIVFESTMESSAFDLYIMDLNDFSLTRVTENEYEDRCPDWSPDGEEILFISKSPYSELYSIFSRNLGEDIEYSIIDNGYDNREPSWSPEGEKIVFSSNMDGYYNIYITDLQGIEVEQITENTFNQRGPVWSPDEEKIAYWVEKEGHKPDIYVMKADGSSQTKLTNDPGTDIFPSWSNDGDSLYFSSNRSKSMDIYVMDANGGDVKAITDTPGVDTGAKCQPR